MVSGGMSYLSSTLDGMTDRIVIPVRSRETIPVELGGKDYLVKAPKGAMAIVIGKQLQEADSDIEKMMEALSSWMLMAFGAKQAAKVEARLQDPDDDLDLPDIMLLIEKLTEAVTANPTS
jgi:hypothetical protein